MNATFVKTKKGVWAYIQKSIRIDGRSTTRTIRRLGLLEEIQKREGCADPRQWVINEARRLTEEEKAGKTKIALEFDPGAKIGKDERPLRIGGDLFLLPLYTRLGLSEICRRITGQTRVKYDLNEIISTLVFGRILFPCSKIATFEKAREMVCPPGFEESDMYRALSLWAGHFNDIQAEVYRNSCSVMERRQRVIYYDCTNYFFEIEENDKDYIDSETGEVVTGLRKKGKSKENRMSPIVQMGMFMDMDGIPLAMVVFPGNESEQTSLQPLEEVLNRQFGMTEYVVSTDAGLASEGNRRYNMAEGRDYVCVQSIPSLKEKDQEMAMNPKGWRIAFCKDGNNRRLLEERYSADGIFDLDTLKEGVAAEIADENRSYTKSHLHDVTLFKEIIVVKELKYENPEWLSASRKNPGQKRYDDADGNRIPHKLTSRRNERIIVTYSQDFADYLAFKRNERIKAAESIIKRKAAEPRTSQQSPRQYIATVHKTKDGQTAQNIEMGLDEAAIEQDKRFDGFYAYGTSLDNEAADIFKIRGIHHEIEHLFRTTKTHLDARPVYLSRQDRIRSHFLICFLSMVILKMLQRQLSEKYEEYYRENPLSIDSLIAALRSIRFGEVKGRNYIPMYQRTDLTDQLQSLSGIEINNEIITSAKMRACYRKCRKS